ncbi:unnamed protein product [Oikopleura dioica]|uniref:Ionotropic glutamate receptor C-terminal domain-containing protein n=1 Tax=Oikopleura dioica TaxID=34765 RepID=E4XM69_OIKDI|nr:unnamed protein product [Oikopleura dioica]
MSLSNALFWGWAGLFWQSPETVPRAPSSRITAILWYAAGVTIVASYTANLVTFLTVRKQQVPLDTFPNLRAARFSRGFKYGFVEHSAVERYFCHSTDEILKNICRDVTEADQWTVGNTKEGLRRAREENYAFISDHILLEHIISTHEPCDLRLSQGRLVGKFGFGLGFKKNSNLTNLFSVGILRMRENLEITELYEKWIKQDGDETPPKCSQNEEEETQAVTESNKLTFDNLKGLFLLVWGSLVLGFLFLIIEWIVSCYTLMDSKSGAPKTMIDAFKLRMKYVRQNTKIIKQRYTRKRESFSRSHLSPVSKVFFNDRNGSS